MIIDLARDRHAKDDKQYDIVVVGTGPAGTTIVNELIRLSPKLRICVLESGKIKSESFSSELKQVLSNKLRIKDHSRERQLGGTSATWHGLSSPFETICVKGREWLDNDRWPIDMGELNNYYGQAAKRYRFPELDIFGLMHEKEKMASEW